MWCHNVLVIWHWLCTVWWGSAREGNTSRGKRLRGFYISHLAKQGFFSSFYNVSRPQKLRLGHVGKITAFFCPCALEQAPVCQCGCMWDWWAALFLAGDSVFYQRMFICVVCRLFSSGKSPSNRLKDSLERIWCVEITAKYISTMLWRKTCKINTVQGTLTEGTRWTEEIVCAARSVNLNTSVALLAGQWGSQLLYLCFMVTCIYVY